MKHPISPDTSGLYEKIWNFVREQLSVRYPFFRRLLWNFSFQESSETSSAGTDFRPVFAYVQNLRNTGALRNLKGLLYFTDGDGIYPERPTDYQTAFIFYREKALHQKVPVWAHKLYMDET